MDFKNKLIHEISTYWPKKKFSIRLSILSIVLILLVGVSLTIIGINYFSVNSILIKSSKNHLTQASSRVAEQVSGYLSPLNSNSLMAHRILDERIVEPGKSENFTQFLYALIADNEYLSGAYWGNTQGDLYWFNRGKDKKFVEEIILRESGNVKASLRKLDSEGDMLSIDNNITPSLKDPRLRPWYQQAQTGKKLTWVIYQFASIEGQRPQLGITAAQPVYDDTGNLRGVFGIDMLFKSNSSFSYLSY